MAEYLRTDGIRSIGVIQVIETKTVIGLGVPSDPVREITQYWDMDGNLLAEADEFLDQYKAEHAAELMEKAISELKAKS